MDGFPATLVREKLGFNRDDDRLVWVFLRIISVYSFVPTQATVCKWQNEIFY